MVEKVETPEEFYFRTPLYARCDISDILASIVRMGDEHQNIDGHCVECGKISPFYLRRIHIRHSNYGYNHRESDGHQLISAVCQRNTEHEVKFYIKKDDLEVTKVGQYPSLADISLDELQPYRKGMTREDSSELHKAIGLAAHGAGVGSFVYMRRVFERLIYSRFDLHKDEMGWDDSDFKKMRMDEKVLFLKDYLPDFLVEHRSIYGILSLGIHELDDTKCLSWFGAMKESTFIILEDDKKKREENERRAAFSGLIKDFKA